MKKLITMCAGAALTIFASCNEGAVREMPYNQGINVIPTPVELTQTDGNFTVSRTMAFSATTHEAKNIAESFAPKLHAATG